MSLKKIVLSISVFCLLIMPSFSCADTIISGDLKISGGGDLVFSDGSVQSKAQVQGLKGEKGDKGDTGGPPNTLTIGNVSTGNPGTAAGATITGTAPNQTLNLLIPQGPQGQQGQAAQITLNSICTAISQASLDLPTFCYGTIGTVTGNVKTTEGVPFPYIDVHLAGRSTSSDSSGNFIFNNVKNGGYDLTCNLPGHSVNPGSITVNINNNNSINNIFLASNRPPSANAGSPQIVPTGVAVSLNGSGSSDPDGDSLTYTWSFISKPTGSSVANIYNGATPSFVPDVPGSYVINLRVSDKVSTSTTSSVTITAVATTNVGGNISTDTVWTKANSPYKITSNLQIGYGSTLTIEAGVTVYSGNIQVYGNLIALGTSNDIIIFNNVYISSASPEHSMPSYVNIQYAKITNGSISPGTNYGYFDIRDSVLLSIPYLYVWYPTSNCHIERNIFINSGGLSIGNNTGINVYVTNNVFYKQTGSYAVQNWASYGSSQTIVRYNSFLSTDRNALSLSTGPSAIIADNNYWGTTDTNIIDNMIYDKNDNFGSAGYITYQPILISPHADTPDPTPYLN